MKFALSYSGGKDCMLALYRMINEGHSPVALITTVNTEQERSWFHGARLELLNTVSNSLGIPLIKCMTNADNYTVAYEDVMIKAKQMGAEACVFGDIDIGGHKLWNEERCIKAGLKCVLPLWGENREDLVIELIDVGFKAMIIIVQSSSLDESYLGQVLSIPLVEKMKAAGICVCGENGEYHTFVFGGPVFKTPILVEAGEIFDFGTYKGINITDRFHILTKHTCIQIRT